MFVLRRLGAICVLIAILSVALFALMAWMPEPRPGADVAGGARVETTRVPWTTRYRCWLVGGEDCRQVRRGVLRGDLGHSSAFRAPLGPILAARLSASLWLLVPALLASIGLSLLLGTWMALRPESAGARALDGSTLLGLGVPKHWAALLLLWGVQSSLGLGALERAPLLWPWLVLILFYVSRWTRYVRGSMADELASPHVELARAKGLPEHRVVAHALRGAVVPFVAVVSQSIPVVFSGSVVVESVFSYPGMGLLILQSLRAADPVTAVTVFLLYAAFTFLASLAADLAYRSLDPRIGS